MKLYSSNRDYKLYQGNMLDMLEVIEPNTIDSIITDPPYELNFMNKGWDNSGIAFQPSTWQKCYEVLKPGGYLLAFGGSRTFHRIACAIEDAGFEIRDTIMWLYGSGFPKSMDISKQIDKKPQANRTIEFKKWLKQKLDNCGKSYKQINDECGFTATSYSKTDFKDNWSTNHPNKEKWLKMKEIIGITENDYDWVCENNIEKRGYIATTGGLAGGSGYTVGCYTGKQLSNNAIDNKAKQWQGWGTCLKPSYEPIIVARKPFKGSLVDNVIEYGVGGINIDECRVGSEVIKGGTMPDFRDIGQKSKEAIGIDKLSFGQVENAKRKPLDDHTGRFPANTILTYDETDFDEVCGGFPDTNGGKRHNTVVRAEDSTSYGGKAGYINTRNEFNDSGSASRYFYCAKASKKDRDEGLDTFIEEKVNDGRQTPIDNPFQRGETLRRNSHPCVKPCELMQYLIRLVSPNGAIILDPFNGSGSTGKAVMYENKERNKNYKYIGIELTEEYLPISKARIEYVCNMKPEINPQINIFELLKKEGE